MSTAHKIDSATLVPWNLTSYGEAIPTGSNLNNFRTPGVYGGNSTVINSLVNCPVSQYGAQIIVKEGFTANRTQQIIFVSDGRIFIRGLTADGWATWKQLNMTDTGS